MSAAVTAGASNGGYDDWTEAQARMTSVSERRFMPDAAALAVYNELYAIYRELHDAFGGVRRDADLEPGDETVADDPRAGAVRGEAALKCGPTT